MAKEGYKPTAGMKAAAKRALRWKEQGKAKGAGTMVGWTRAGQLARGETLSLSTVKRMYSFFSRHEVDKKGKDFYNTSDPSNGRIMWDAWGGDAITKALRPEVTREQMYAVIEHLKEAIEALIETPEEETESEDMPENGEQAETEVEDVYKSDNEDEDKWDNEMQKCWTGYRQEGMKEKNGRMVPNCVPVDKSYDLEDKEEPIKKSIWDGTFIK